MISILWPLRHWLSEITSFRLTELDSHTPSKTEIRELSHGRNSESNMAVMDLFQIFAALASRSENTNTVIYASCQYKAGAPTPFSKALELKK